MARSFSEAEEWQPARLRRVVAASMIGTTIEWYDFFLYGSAAALVFNKLFFPSFDPFVGTLLAFATYAVGFVARPLGGIVFGHYRRPDRPQAAAHAEPDPDGRRHRPDRPPAHLCPDRDLGARGPHRASAGPGLRGRRRMGRSGADGGRAWRQRPPRLLGELAAGRSGGGQPALRRRAGADRRAPERGRFPRLGLADPLPPLGAARRRRLVHPQPGRGEPDVREGARGGRGSAQAAGDGRPSRAAAARSCSAPA